MKRFAIITIALMAVMSLSATLYAAGDMNKSSDMQKKGYAASDLNKAGKLDGKTGIAQTPGADELRGMKVVSLQGEAIGKIVGVNEDTQTGHVKFVTISKGGILGIGGEKIPVPLEAFSFEKDHARLIVSTSKLENAPAQAELTDEQFQHDLESHYGISPAWGQESSIEENTQQMKTQSDEMMDSARKEMEY